MESLPYKTVSTKDSGLKVTATEKAKFLSIMVEFTKEISSMVSNTGMDACTTQAATFTRVRGKKIRSMGKE